MEKFDGDRNLVQTIGTSGRGDGQLLCPSGVAIGADGDVFVSDIGRGDIQRFSADGTFVAVSHHTAAAWRHVTDSEVIPNGVDLARWRYGDGGPALAWSGRIVPEKGTHLAIEIAQAAGMPLRLAGPIGDQQYYDSAVRPLLGHGIEYLGHLCQDDLARVVASSAATLVTPRWDEPYGLVVAESLACGTPVCALKGCATIGSQLLIPRDALWEMSGPGGGSRTPDTWIYSPWAFGHFTREIGPQTRFASQFASQLPIGQPRFCRPSA